MTTPGDGQAELDLLPVGIAHVDGTATIVRGNAMFAEMIGLPLADLVGRNLFDFAAGDLGRYVEMFHFGTGFDALMGPVAVSYRHTDGRLRHSALWALNHLDRPGVEAMVCTFVPEETTSGLSAALTSIAEGEHVDATLELLAATLAAHPFQSLGCWLVRDDGGRRVAGDRAMPDAVRAAVAQHGGWWRALRGGSAWIHRPMT